MSFLLRRTDKCGAAVYVAPQGSPKSYVTKVKARVFFTREEAESNRCSENEIVERAEQCQIEQTKYCIATT